jgi:RecB family exonuclease
MECPLQAKFREVDFLPGRPGSKATFGSCIHAGLEHYNRTGDVDTAVKLFTEAWENPPSIGLPEIEVWNKFTSFGGLRTRGVEILRAYHDRMKIEQRSVIVAEHRFLVPFGAHELTGTVDLVSVRKNHRSVQLLTVEDYKTQTKPPNISELALNIQFTVYLYALSQPEFWFGNGDQFPAIPNGDWYYEMCKGMPKRGIWVHLWQNGKEMDAGGRDEEDFARLYRLCCEVERAIEHQVFVPNIGEACHLCDYAHDPCPVTPPTREWWENRRLDEDEESWA